MDSFDLWEWLKSNSKFDSLSDGEYENFQQNYPLFDMHD